MNLSGASSPGPPGSPPLAGSIDLSDASVSAGGPSGGPGSDGSTSSDCCSELDDCRCSCCASLRPLPLLRSPEFGPDDDIEVLLEAIRRKLPTAFHVGRTRSDHGDYADDVCMAMGGGGMLEVLEAREEAMRLQSMPGEEDADTLLRDAALCSQSIEL